MQDHRASAGNSQVPAGRVALVAGASGLVGRALLARLGADPGVAQVHALVRRPLDLVAPKLQVHVVDFNALPPLPAADEAYLALGTTIAVAGSREAFRAVDFDANLAVAKAAGAAGARRVGLVSAMGADARSRVFYSRVKGELEEALSALPLDALVIARPSLLLGDRDRLGQSRRRGEHLAARLDRSPAHLAGEVGERLRTGVRRAGATLALLAPVVVALGVMAPERARSAWTALASPLARFTGPALPPLGVAPGDVELVRGSELEVVITAEGRETVTLLWQAAGDIARTAVLTLDEDRAVHVFPSVTASMVYRVTAPDGAAAGEFTVTPRDPLFVTDVTARLTFPAHTHRPPEEYRGDLPPLRIPVGTSLALEGQGSRPLGAARLCRRDRLDRGQYRIAAALSPSMEPKFP